MKANTKQNLFLLSLVVGALLGLFLGYYFEENAIRFQFLGTLFLNALKSLIVPLVMSSMIVGICQMGSLKHIGLLGRRTLIYYMSTTLLAVIIGVILVNWIEPGKIPMEHLSSQKPEHTFNFQEVLMGLISPNLFESMLKTQILPLILFSIVFGLILTQMGIKSKPLIDLIDIIFQALMKIVQIIMVFAPIGVMGLIAGQLGEAGGLLQFLDQINALKNYSLTVVLALFIHGFIILPLLLFLLSKKVPWRFAKQCSVPLISAFSTASSSATLPLSLEAVEKEAGIQNKTASFVLPLGATINMDGTALYEAIAAIFIAQLYGIELSFTQQILVILTASLAAIGAAGIPHAGTVTMVMVLETVGLPLEGIGLIFAVDWLLDRCRTTVNVWGDMVGAAIMDRYEEG